MMGLKTSIYWISWFVKNLIYLILVCIVYTIIFNIKFGDKGKILNYIQPSLFFVFLLLYVIATIAFCFMISTFFSKGEYTANVMVNFQSVNPLVCGSLNNQTKFTLKWLETIDKIRRRYATNSSNYTLMWICYYNKGFN